MVAVTRGIAAKDPEEVLFRSNAAGQLADIASGVLLVEYPRIDHIAPTRQDRDVDAPFRSLIDYPLYVVPVIVLARLDGSFPGVTLGRSGSRSISAAPNNDGRT